jgi:predicted Zn-dependent peptidase
VLARARLAGAEAVTVQRTELSSGAIIISERMLGVQSATFGLYFPTGSRHENLENNGISHLLEHLVFRGTRKRSADEVNCEIDLLGGTANAYTSKEVICLHAHVLAEHLPRIVELYGDLAAEALPPGLETEFERERGVILQEIAGVEDSPEDLAGDLCDQAFFGAHPLGLPVVGSARAMARLDLDRVRRHYRSHLVAEGLVVAAAGDVDHPRLVALVERHLCSLPVRGARAAPVTPVPQPATRVLERDTEQVHLCLSAPGVARGDRRRHALDLLSALAGDGYSSRLFREVRDRRGLAYSIYSASSGYLDSGTFDIQVSVAPEHLREALEVISHELADLREGGIRPDELERSRQHLRSSSILAHESSGARTGFIAEQALLQEDASFGFEAELAALERVELRELNALAAELLGGRLALAAVGPISADALPSGGLELSRRG